MITINSSKILINKLMIGDVNSDYIATLNNKDYMRFSRHNYKFHDLESQKQYISNFNNFDKHLLSIKDAGSNTLVGTCTVYIDYSKHNIDVGFLIFISKAGNKYATLALESLMGYFSNNFPNFTVSVGTNISNRAMQGVAISNGLYPNLLFGTSETGMIQYKKLISPLSEAQTPMIPPFINSAKTIGIAANDVGGAQQIYNLMKTLDKPFVALLNGPAIKVFENGNINYQLLKSESDLLECELVITGSGWMSNLEFNVLRLCQLNLIPCLTILDHWVNYRARFSRDFDLVPNMLAVTNQLALSFAKKEFLKTPIFLIPDFELIEYQLQINQALKRDKVLVLLEPNSGLSDYFLIHLDMELEIINKALIINQEKGYSGVIVRPHPSTLSLNSKILDLINNIESISISSNVSLKDDFKVANVVAGFSSYGLYLSSLSGIETYSYFAKDTKHWTNFYPQILPLV